MSGDRDLLTRCFDAALSAVHPLEALRPHLPDRPAGRTVVVGAGKGVAQMAAAFETLWGRCEGVVVTRYGYGCPTAHIRVMEAAHPVPDAAGLAASQALFDAVAGLGPEDLVVALVCGGGSALLAAPAPGLDLADEVALNRALLASGAPIGVMNALRKQFSAIKGGRLAAAAHPARVVSLIVSDVPGDDPAQVASGPTVPDACDRAMALRLVQEYRLDLPQRLLRFLHDAPADAPTPADPGFARDRVRIVASATHALEAAAEVARGCGAGQGAGQGTGQSHLQGLAAHILSDAIEGEARDVARVHAAIIAEMVARARPFAPPALILSGGETTVTLPSHGGPLGPLGPVTPGKGGRNTEFLLAFALAVEGLPGVSALAADTDGIDGSEDNAGAFADGGTAARMRAAGIDPAAVLARHDAYSAFAAIGDLFVTGPTGTNVNDFRAILVTPG